MKLIHAKSCLGSCEFKERCISSSIGRCGRGAAVKKAVFALRKQS